MSRLAILKVADKLRGLLNDVVFVGGCAGLLLMPSEDSEFRPTDDVDFVVPVTTYLELTDFEARLRDLGCINCQERGAPICRWEVDGVTVDLMPVEPGVLGFGNRWYQEALKSPVLVELTDGLFVRVANLPVFLATKFEAHASRGGGIFFGDSDIEDILLLLAQRTDALELIQRAPEEVRSFLRDEATKLLEVDGIRDVISACFGQQEQALAMEVLAVLEELKNEAPPRYR